jgi:UDP-3-O-[3-hydroxymyristoyl] N-acetylglucosamine deacetylase/3-hydroxyacyl-[acyl-carrier-protein] dehydratase
MTNLNIKQKTIAKEVTLSGVGLHTGKSVNMTFKPAPENYGYAIMWLLQKEVQILKKMESI